MPGGGRVPDGLPLGSRAMPRSPVRHVRRRPVRRRPGRRRCGSAGAVAECQPCAPGDRCDTAAEPASMEGWEALGQTTLGLPDLITNPMTCGSVAHPASRCSTRTTSPSRAPDRTAQGRVLRPRPRTSRPRSRPPMARSSGRSKGHRGIYIFDVDLPEAGTYGRRVHDRGPGQPGRRRSALTFDVHAVVDRRAGRADAAPASKTPTLADVGGDVTKISTDTKPDPAFYETSVADALAAHKPFVLVFATPKFCKSAQCGPTLDKLKPVAAANPERDVHQRRAVPAQGRRRPAPAGPDRQQQAPGDGRRPTPMGAVERALDLRGRRRRRGQRRSS